MRLAPALRTALATAPLLPGAACSAYRPARVDPAAPPSEPVRVRYAAPQPVRAVSSAGDTVPYPRAREVVGRVVAASGDTLDLDVRKVDGVAPAAVGTRARLAPARGRAVEAEGVDVGRTIGNTIVVALVAGGAVVFAWVLAMSAASP